MIAEKENIVLFTACLVVCLAVLLVNSGSNAFAKSLVLDELLRTRYPHLVEGQESEAVIPAIPPEKPLAVKPAPAHLPQVAFFNRLIKQGTATKEDACRAAATLLKLPEAMGDFETLVAVLKANKIIPSPWTFAGSDPARQGFVCMLFMKSLEIEGGLVARVFGVNGRTAYREMVDRRLTAPTGDRTNLSGSELITLLQRSSRLLKSSRKEQ